MFTSWVFEVTNSQAELARLLNFYLYPSIVIGGLIMLPFSFSFDVGVQIIGCLICIGWTVVATIIFFRRCTISDDRNMHKQESLLSTGIKLFSNPLTTAIILSRRPRARRLDS